MYEQMIAEEKSRTMIGKDLMIDFDLSAKKKTTANKNSQEK